MSFKYLARATKIYTVEIQTYLRCCPIDIHGEMIITEHKFLLFPDEIDSPFLSFNVQLLPHYS